MREYERFLADPAFAAAVTARYRGRHGPADALWWLDHPDESSPRGLPAPSAAVRELRMLAYSPAGDTDAEAALLSLEQQLRADRAATIAALTEPADPAIPEAIVARAAETATAGRHSRVGLAATVTGVALLAGLAVGVSLAPASAPTPVVSQTAQQATSRTPTMLDVFSRSRVESDTPRDLAFGFALDPSTFYRLSETPVSPNGDVQLVYAVRDAAGSPCLVLIAGVPRATTITCVAPPGISAAGISAYLQTETVSYAATWSPDGSVTVSSGPLPVGAIPQ